MLIAIVISQSAGNIMSSIKDQSLTGFKWSAIGEVSTHGISFVLGLIIARLLMPEDFGVIGMLAIFMAISEQFVNCGFGKALIRNRQDGGRSMYGFLF